MSIYEMRLKHDQSGRIVEKIETVKGKAMKWTYSYDKKGRLFEAHLDNRLVCQCHYDRDGRRQQDYFPRTHGSQLRNYHYRMDNRLQQAGNNGYTHDKEGFRSIWNHEGKYTLYKYAPDYRLLEVEKPDDKAVFEFTHDDDGQREVKYRNGEMVEAYKWLDFIRLAGFHDGEDGYRFVYDKNERTPYAMQREDGAVAYLHYDQVGSLRVVADKSGNVIKEVLYDPFGGIIEDSNPDLRIPIGFAGGLHDRDLGFVRFGWRDYDTFTSRWTAPDPIGDAGGDPDWYGYCLDDPVNMADPKGLAAGDWWDILANINKAEEIGKEELRKRGAGNHNNEGDAMRHAEWSRRMSEEIGPVTSWTAGMANEVKGLFKGYPWDETMMDIKNNAEGRAAASEGRPVDRSKLQKKPKGGFQVNPYDPSKYWFQR